ncbi:MAG: GxxExxY protein [bacterium]|nr:GxxExxY protein [bacterium]
MEKNITLKTSLEHIFRLTPGQKRALGKLRLHIVNDLLHHFPARYTDTARVAAIGSLKKGDQAVIYGKIHNLKTKKAWKKKIPMAEGTVADETGSIKAIWFHQPYIAKMTSEGELVRVEGKVSERLPVPSKVRQVGKGELFLSNPRIERIMEVPQNTGPLFGDGTSETLYPVYPESRGITSNWLYHAIMKMERSGVLDAVEDPIPDEMLKRYNLPTLKTALIWIHSPQKQSHADGARKRFAFEEVFFIQLARLKERSEYAKNPSFDITVNQELVHEFLERFPFKMTDAQSRAIKQILLDFKKEHPMSRLLEGDVGSGKTAVAAATAYAVITGGANSTSVNRLQVAIMAPTEILAQQHFENFIKYFSYANIPVALITGSGCKKFPSKINPLSHTPISRAQLLKWVANGEIPILVGTHALIQKAVKFQNLAYVIIDEQHRFGVQQRSKLVARGYAQMEKVQIDADNSAPKSDFLYKDLTYTIRNVIFTVHNELGPGHKEYVYQRAIEEELKKRRLLFEREKKIDVLYNKKKIGIYQPDFVIDGKVILEIKALAYIGPKEKKQLWSYIKGSDYRVALLANLGTERVQIERVVHDTARLTSATSALNLRTSAKVRVPHFLSMTATPIPRTLALTVYGDLDLTLIDEMPPGRKTILTEVVTRGEENRVYKKMREEISAGRQAYIICPRIDEPDPEKELALNTKSVKEEAMRLDRDVFPDFTIAVLHGKMKPAEREDIMKQFEKGEIQILVATSVIEVGVNVPNATIIVIEGAERFGLAQLHQLRGRVLRSTHQAYCFLFSSTEPKVMLPRLSALVAAKNGFELAEIDLALRGMGSLAGGKQWGITDVGMEAIKNLKMVEAARGEAQTILSSDPEFLKFPAIKERMNNKKHDIHFE